MDNKTVLITGTDRGIVAEGIYFLVHSRNIIGEILISDGGRSLR